MTTLCPECLEWVEEYDGGEANNCLLNICPQCGCDFDDPWLCWHNDVYAEGEPGHEITICKQCGMIVQDYENPGNAG